MNRRDFIQASALLLAGAALPSLTSCATATARRRPSPSGRINLGVIGFGTIAHDTIMNFLGDPRVQVVAVADPVTDLPHYGYQGEYRGGRLVGQQRVEQFYAEESASGGAFSGCTPYEDFRTMLDREDLDAVYIATPDHWHCAVAVHAARKGKHIYGQKPLALTIGEGRRIADTVKSTGIVWQTGSQQRSSLFFRTACEYVRNGRLGRVQHITVGIPGGHKDWSGLAARNQPETPPRELNYDLWLGPAPEREYTPALGQLNWRHNWDYSGGMITDWGAHHLDIVQWALNQDAGGPVRIEIKDVDVPPPTAIYNTAKSFTFDVVYADGTRVSVSDKHTNGIRFEGEGGKSVFVARDKLQFNPVELRLDKIRPDEIHLYESKVHESNFVDCIFSKQPTAAPAEVSHRTITISHLANIAIRLGRSSLQWDPSTETVVNDPQANAMLTRPMRKKYAI